MFLKTRLLRDYGMIVTGNVLVQFLTFLFIPFLSRAYSSHQFGVLSIMMSSSALLSVLLGLRYEFGVMLPKLKVLTCHMFVLSLLLPVVLSPVCYGLFCVLQGVFSKVFAGVEPWQAVVCAVATTYYLAFYNYLLKKEAFGLCAGLTVCKPLTVLLLQMSLVGREGGLVIGYVSANLIFLLAAGCMLVAARAFFFESSVSFRYLKYAFWRYRKFPIYSTPAAFLNMGGNHLPSFLIRHFWGEGVLGWFFMSRRLVLVPLNLLSQSMRQVISQRVTKKIANKQPVFRDVLRICLLMSILSVFISTCFYLLSKYNCFVFILGDKWEPVQGYVAILCIYLLFSFVSKCLGGFAMYERQEVGLYFQGALLVASFASIYFGSMYFDEFSSVLLLYSVIMSVVAVVQVLISVYLSCIYSRRLK